MLMLPLRSSYGSMMGSHLLRTLFLITALMLTTVSSESHSQADEQVYQQAVRSTVWIVTETGSGSGVVVAYADGRKVVATANHVTEGASQVMCCFPLFDADGELITDREQYGEPKRQGVGIPARVISADPGRDLALLEPERIPEGISAISLAGRVRVGAQIHIVGNSPAAPLFGYMTGTVRGVFHTPGTHHTSPVRGHEGEAENSSPIQGKYFTTDAAVNPGDSGGPVIYRRNDQQLELVGLVQSFALGARLVSNMVHVSELSELMTEPLHAPAPVRRKLEPNVQRRGGFEFQFQPASSRMDAAWIPENPLAPQSASTSLSGIWRVTSVTIHRDYRIQFEAEGRCQVMDESGAAVTSGSYLIGERTMQLNLDGEPVLIGQILPSGNGRFQLLHADDSFTEFVKE